MKRPSHVLILAALLLAACAPKSSLWGVYPTPTARPSADPAPASATPSSEASPTLPSEVADPPQPTLTSTPAPSLPVPTRTPSNPSATQKPPILYYTQSGDTLDALAARFGAEKQEITSPQTIPQRGLIDPGVLLIIPDRIEVETTSGVHILPDSEVIFADSAADFDLPAFIHKAGGYLDDYSQWLGSTAQTTGAQGLERLARENSVNPRLILAVLEYESHWVYGEPTDLLHEDYPMGYQSLKYKGLFMQMVWTVNQLFTGYYGWRDGTLTELTFPDGEKLRLQPELNAGTVAVQYLFSRQHNRAEWERILNPDSSEGFPALYTRMFGDPWARAQLVEPLFPPGLAQPTMSLPFEPNRQWSLTSGPHGAWEPGGPLAAIDFAPASAHTGCDVSDAWVLASAPGIVVYSDSGLVVLDLDGDRNEHTGWDLIYMHIAAKGRVAIGTRLEADGRIGHPSCEGGEATGTHLHLARKYNGEWIPADGPLPLVLSGWTVHAGANPYQGTMTRGSRTVIADLFGQSWSIIIRLPDE